MFIKIINEEKNIKHKCWLLFEYCSVLRVNEVTISKDRKNGLVTFEYKDYKDNSKIKKMTIAAFEFIRRFLLHVFPDSFTKKHYGILSNRNKKGNIKLCRFLISKTVTNKFVSSISREFYVFFCDKCSCNNFSFSFFYNIRPRIS